MKCEACGHPLVKHRGLSGTGESGQMCAALIDRPVGPDLCSCTAGLSEGLAWVQVNGRWPLILPQHRAERPEWYFWEAARLAAMAHHLGPGDVVYDIGAEEGDLPALWASWRCDVALIEPNPRVWPNIRTIFEANALTPPLSCFVGFAAGESHAHGDWVGRPHWPTCADGPVIGDHGFLNLAERDDVARVRIDDFAAQIEPPTAITIDVEGAELEVLKGAERTLDEHRPKVWVSIHPEFIADMYGVDDGLPAVRSLMAAHNYDEQFLAIDHEHHWMFLPR